MKYFRETENPTARLPAGFMQGFLEVGVTVTASKFNKANCHLHRVVVDTSTPEGHPTLYST